MISTQLDVSAAIRDLDRPTPWTQRGVLARMGAMGPTAQSPQMALMPYSAHSFSATPTARRPLPIYCTGY